MNLSFHPFKRRVSRPLRQLIGPSLLFMGVFLMSSQASAVGLQKAKGILEVLKTEVLAIVPLIAVLALIIMGIGYATKFVEKETFVRWAIGIIIIGSAAQITSMFMG